MPPATRPQAISDASKEGRGSPRSSREVFVGRIRVLARTTRLSRAYAPAGRKKFPATYRATFRPIQAPSIVELRK